ncbi:MAG: Gfo/Idh/MocA family oxidoreductase [Tepidisphaeraceae bacterium]
MSATRVGMIGTGGISGQYLKAAKNLEAIEFVALADLNVEAAKAKATEFGVKKACSVDELLADPSIEIVLNLTIPAAHVPVGLRTLAAGKHTFLEKPLGVDVNQAQRTHRRR